jgi:hypothetical protein
MTTRRSAVLLLVVPLLVAAGLAGCGGDGDDDDAGTTTTTEAAGTDDETTSTTAPEGDDTTTTEVPDDGSTTTEGGSTTSPNLPPNDSPLAEYLLDPAAVGPGFAPDDALGNGSLDTDLCEEVTLEETWDDQAAQALLSGTEEDEAIFQQAVLRFPDDAAAEAFATELADSLVACQPGTETTALDGVGDLALLATAPEVETSAATAGVVQEGDIVVWLLGISAPGAESPVDQDILTAAAELLAG